MHPLTYQAKRTHWNATWEAIRRYRACAVNWNEPTLEDMTPARSDLLQTVWNNFADRHEVRRAKGMEPEGRSMHLADVRSTLGLAGATVWKGVQTLVELEWVTVVPCPHTKRRLVVHLTALGIHALRMAQRCAAEWSILVNDRPRRGFDRLVDDFVRSDADTQRVLSTDAETTPSPGKSFRRWRDYFWWLVEHVRTMARHFGCKAERLYFRYAEGQLVRDEDDPLSGVEPPPQREPQDTPRTPAELLLEDPFWRRFLAEDEPVDERFPA